MGKWTLIVVVFIAVIGIGAAIEGGDRETERQQSPPAATIPANPAKPTSKKSRAITPKMIVDVMEGTNPMAIRRLCRGVETVGPHRMLVSFTRGYNPTEPGQPSAAEVFAEAMTRC